MTKFSPYEKILLIRIIAFIYLFIGYFTFCSAQQSTKDSLKTQLKKIELKLTPTVEKDTSYINLLLEVAFNERYYNNDSLLLLSERALKLSRKLNYMKGESLSLGYIANYYADIGQTKKAISIYEESIFIIKTINNPGAYVDCLIGLGNIYNAKGNYAKSVNHYLTAIKISSENNLKKRLLSCNANMGLLYYSLKDYEYSLVYFKKAYTLSKEVKDTYLNPAIMSYISSIYAELEDYELAMSYINKSINALKKETKYQWLAHSYKIKGTIYFKQKKYNWALNSLEESKQLHKKIDDDLEKTELYIVLSDVYFELEKYKNSKKYASAAYELANKLGLANVKQESSFMLYKIYKEEKKHETALKYFEIHNENIDSRDDNEKVLGVAKAQMEYEQQENKLILENKKTLEKKQNYIYAAFSITLISFMIIFLVLKSRKLQEKLNQKLRNQKIALIKREAELKETNETKNMLFSIIGHDLRGPIGALEGVLGLYKKGNVDDKGFLNLVPKLHEDVSHVSFTLNNLLSWSLTQMNGVNSKPAKIQLNSVVKENTNLLSEGAKIKSIKIINNLKKDIKVWCDKNQLDIIFRNLLSNALKFTPKDGFITISSQEEEKNWIIAIKDTGVGMDKYTQEKIFKKGPNTTTYGTNNEKGTGLGLSLCKEMIEKNNGSMWLESTVNKGSTFYFRLPKNALDKTI